MESAGVEVNVTVFSSPEESHGQWTSWSHAHHRHRPGATWSLPLRRSRSKAPESWDAAGPAWGLGFLFSRGMPWYTQDFSMRIIYASSNWLSLPAVYLNRKLDEHRVMEGTSLPYQATYHIFARMVPPNAFSGPAWLLCQTGRPCVPNCAGPSGGCSSLWPIYQLYSFTYLCVCVCVGIIRMSIYLYTYLRTYLSIYLPI